MTITPPDPGPRHHRWRRWLKGLGLVALLLVATVAGRCLYAFRDRNPGYTVAIAIDGSRARSEPRPLRVGFGRLKITPDVKDPARPVWLAGFSQNRAATGVHDDLWAIAMVLDDGHTRLAVVSLDAIGFFHDDVIAVRRRVASLLQPAPDYTVVCSTHNHSTPDLMGLWGRDYLHSGVLPEYRELVIRQAADAVAAAVSNLQPARLVLHEIPTPPDGLVIDTRPPQVFDADLRVMHFLSPTGDVTLGTLVGWADHPETVWSKNTEVTADFPGYLREALEEGVLQGGAVVAEGRGGTHLFVNGAVGGLMTSHPRMTVRDPYLQQDFQKPTHEKTRALGRQLFSRVIPRLRDTNAPSATHVPISIRARTLELPMDNSGFLLAPVLGLVDRGHSSWMKLRTEVALITVGDAAIACIPGEIYPELVNGGIESPPGGDFPGPPVEVPPLRQLMPGRVRWVFGLANDEIGYIIPRSEWDRESPWLYNSKGSHYGEVNSPGPETATRLHAAFREICRAASH